MKTLRTILHTGQEIVYETDKETALAAFEEWNIKLKNLGINIENFIKIDFVRLFDENNLVIDSLEWTV